MLASYEYACFTQKKCEKYWPDRGESIEVKQIKVTNIEVANCGGFTKTRLMIDVNASQVNFQIHEITLHTVLLTQ